ncbi:sigma-70 family RNA polymerase sigma factor [Pseudenhygromyxa sp. WMMC2535]|nr:sigma-70 family RNA polymerase sigma factor [Pseudenhygromyxa sp. WMMC2535]NVB36229.1 sigma-70 family RNA polymerase sigma factor [Pseudenhygromyxa sp. WMMC2535]NVB43728.1 sigma-70 family RNA polymerase sigma factor [Pseudenhygromyxa sp. WMMC2535]NVB43738.1 sigma-70 family RNA polymerase sigma factor [Pseudenhygromyxa sp. WMMC2535]
MLGSEDLTHDAFEALWRKIGSFEARQEDSFLRWVRVFAKNQRVWSRPSKARRSWEQLDVELVARDESPSQAFERREQVRRLESAVAELGSIFVRALRHRLSGGRPEALAADESIHLSAARWRMGEVVRRLRKVLGEAQSLPRVSGSSSA